jgi:oxalate decarboxylase/phosphoglucose isomerase-like protein (cupin superfamily)
MGFKLEDWASTSKVGNGYAADINGKWCSFLETKKGAYRGNHVHPNDQYTVLLGGSAMVVKEIDGKIIEYPLTENEVHLTPKGIAHILVPLEDAILYEWWQGPFVAEPCPGVFDEYTKNRYGPSD